MITKKKTFGPQARSQTKQSQPVESEYDDTDFDTNEAETATPSSKRQTQATRPIGKPQPTRTPSDRRDSGGGSKGSSLADKFKAIAKAFSDTASDVPPGMYEAVISEAIVQAPDAKGQSVRLKFELCDPEFRESNQIPQWFKIFDIDGEPFAGGTKSLMYNFAKLGHQLNFDGDTQEEVCENLQEQLKEIVDERPGIIAKVTNNAGNDGRIFTNVSVQKPAEDNPVVQEYKDNVAY